ncbi:MAG TPA: glycosyltransferase family 39 protein [Chloroflexota bacterium]|jgi:4-amino-4-deoxy-L-arabinose transferase-like glycosyltransferase|nr:glycosyltransferase family 39 protein [Chloroflexota bacterium]
MTAARSVPRDLSGVADLLEATVVLAALASIVSFVIVALLRLGYPFPLQVTESASFEEMLRVLHGQPLYVAPTISHVPMIYGPVYFTLAAAVATVVGPTFSALRAVSLLASLGSLALVGYLVYRETTDRVAAVAAVGLLAVAYPLAEQALDVGRVDALFAFFLLAGLAVARSARTVRGLVASGVLLGLAGLTKLPIGTLPVAGFLCVYLAVSLRMRAIIFAAAFLVTIILGVLLLRAQSGPWATWYLFDLPNQHGINDHGNLGGRFWFLDVLPHFTFALLIGPAFLLASAAERHLKPLLFYGGGGLSLIALSWASRSNSGGATNVLLPTHALVAILFGLGMALILRDVRGRSVRVRAMRAYLVGLCLLQFALLAYNPRLQVPYRSEQWAAERLAARLADLSGSLYAPELDGYLLGSDKGEQPLLGAAGELLGGYGGMVTDEGARWENDLATAFREQRFDHVVLGKDWCCEVQDRLGDAYVSAGPLFPPDDDYWRWTAGRTPTELEVFVPRPR